MHRMQASGLGPVTPEELEIYKWKNSKLSEVEGSVQGSTDDVSRVTKRDGATVAEASLQAAAAAKDQEAVAHEAAALEAEATGERQIDYSVSLVSVEFSME